LLNRARPSLEEEKDEIKDEIANGGYEFVCSTCIWIGDGNRIGSPKQ